MNYAEAKQKADELNEVVKVTGQALQVFPKGSMGLTPDHVKASPEFKAAKAAFDLAFARSRAFNAVFVKTFKKEIQAERRNKYKTI